MSNSIKTTISTQKDFFDQTGQLLPKGNYYFNINDNLQMKDGNEILVGDLSCKGHWGTFSFKSVDLIKMMAIGQSRLARRTGLNEENLPNYDSPICSPKSLRIRSNNTFLNSNLSRNTIVKTYTSGPMELPSCSICLMDISNNLKKLDCDHQFHEHCIDRWLIRKDTCPICRRPVRATLPPLQYPMRPPPAPPGESPYRVHRDNHVNMFLPGQVNQTLRELDEELEAIRFRRRINNIRNRYGLSNM